MKERPILFSTEMVQAILEGRKTQTRRIFKFPVNWKPEDDGWDWAALQEFHPECFRKYDVGDMLWVRETHLFYNDENANDAVLYKAEPDAEEFSFGLFENKPKWRPSIHMPKEAARIWLEITDIRVERLQDISEGDVKAEGVLPAKCCDSYYHGFSILWQSIKGEESWRQDPFVWVIKFKKIDKV